MTTKQELRQLIRQRKQQHAGGEPAAVIERLYRHPRIRQAHTLLLYSALPDEIPTQALTDRLAAEGKTVVLPRVVDATDMELRYYTGRQDLQQGAFGILEPAGALFIAYSLIDVAVIPGMAFDRLGHRLGRGKGYYDRFLSRVPLIYKIGVCFPWQVVDRVPTDQHDMPMDEVLF